MLGMWRVDSMGDGDSSLIGVKAVVSQFGSIGPVRPRGEGATWSSQAGGSAPHSPRVRLPVIGLKSYVFASGGFGSMAYCAARAVAQRSHFPRKCALLVPKCTAASDAVRACSVALARLHSGLTGLTETVFESGCRLGSRRKNSTSVWHRCCCTGLCARCKRAPACGVRRVSLIIMVGWAGASRVSARFGPRWGSVLLGFPPWWYAGRVRVRGSGCDRDRCVRWCRAARRRRRFLAWEGPGGKPKLREKQMRTLR